MLTRILIVLSISTMFSASAYAAIYKWVDEEGKIHYSENRPPQHDAKKMHVPTQAPTNTSTYKKPSLKTDKDKEAKDDKEGKEDNAKAQADSGMSNKEKASECQRAKESIAKLSAGGRFRLKDKDGNVSYMSEEDKQARIEREKERVKRFCK